MKKALAVLGIAALSCLPCSANAEISIKAGVAGKRGSTSGNHVNVNNASLGVENEFGAGWFKHFGIGLDAKLSDQHGAWDNGAGLYSFYRRNLFNDRYYFTGAWGVDFVLAGPEYNKFTLKDDNNHLDWQKWVYLDAHRLNVSAMRGVSVIPNVSLSLGRNLGNHFSIEAGAKASILKYRAQENKFDENGNAYAVTNDASRKVLPEFSFKFGYRF